MKINIVDNSGYKEGYINIVICQNGVRRILGNQVADIRTNMESLSFPSRTIDEIRLQGGFLGNMPEYLRCAFLMGCRSWFRDFSSRLIIEEKNGLNIEFFRNLLEACGFQIGEVAPVTEKEREYEIISQVAKFEIDKLNKYLKLYSEKDPIRNEIELKEKYDKYIYWIEKFRAKVTGGFQLQEGNTNSVVESELVKFKEENPVIIIRLMGGLGNQLYQYAMARRLAIACRARLKIALDWFSLCIEGVTQRDYRLCHFNIYEQFQEIPDLACVLSRDIVLGEWKDGYDYHSRPFLQDCGRGFDPAILNIKGSRYVSGYWVSYKYFQDIADVLRTEFAIKNNLSGDNLELAQKILEDNSVSLHIRRGDYINIGCCLPLDYYYQAINNLKKNVEHPHFYVFSDDVIWVKEHFQIGIDEVTYVSHNGAEQDYEDLRLMSLCKHHIIANSTFSWWGAWLCKNDQKIVYAPDRGNADGNFYPNEDVYPEEWNIIYYK